MYMVQYSVAYSISVLWKRFALYMNLNWHRYDFHIWLMQMYTCKRAHTSMEYTVHTSMEQPNRAPESKAFLIIWNMLGGARFNSYISAIPPVKSSKPSVVEPPERAS